MARYRIKNRYNFAFGPGEEAKRIQAESTPSDAADQFGDPTNAVSNNLAAALNVREGRIYNTTAGVEGMPNRAVGGPAPDPNWDAFFGALQNKQYDANRSGLKFGTNFNHDFGNDNFGPVKGLNSAYQQRFLTPDQQSSGLYDSNTSTTDLIRRGRNFVAGR